MKKMESRAIICILLALALVLGTLVFIGKLIIKGDSWAGFYANKHVFSGGELAVGTVYDRNGEVLMYSDNDGSHYIDDSAVRKATMHVVGDKGRNVVTGANSIFENRIIGYNLITGTKGIFFGKNRQVKLTIDGEISKIAYNALNGYNGFVSLYNWKTGEIICAVSAPTIDPENPPDFEDVEEGTFINKVFSATTVPGSTFKLVTTYAALKYLDNTDEYEYRCNGKNEIDGEYVTCPWSHGKLDFYGSLANSCNGAFSDLTLKVGTKNMKKALRELGLTKSYDINGIKTAKGSFNFDSYDINSGWAGIGQFEDQVNPISMMVFMGAIAGGGTCKSPIIIQGSKSEAVTLMDSDIAYEMGKMMKNNVETMYGGNSSFPGLDMHAKSGTAQTYKKGGDDAVFAGYCGDYAFYIVVEEAGSGTWVAGPVANKVMQALTN